VRKKRRRKRKYNIRKILIVIGFTLYFVFNTYLLVKMQIRQSYLEELSVRTARLLLDYLEAQKKGGTIL
jgi:hypothetical protein